MKEDRKCCISLNRLLPVHESWDRITPRDTDVITKAAHILNELISKMLRRRRGGAGKFHSDTTTELR